ncbi:hypothetical protein GCM10009085_16890 [Pseudomonas avellanae]|nr:hypothetical protein GCM10009085_16890 [Pseudomonas avellanae]
MQYADENPGTQARAHFWQILGGEMQVHTVGTAFRFNRQRFEPFRQTVQDTLSDRATAEIIGL